MDIKVNLLDKIFSLFGKRILYSKRHLEGRILPFQNFKCTMYIKEHIAEGIMKTISL